MKKVKNKYKIKNKYLKLVGIIEKIADICKDNIVNTELTRDIAENVFQDGTHDYELVAKKELSQEIFNVINKGLNDSQKRD